MASTAKKTFVHLSLSFISLAKVRKSWDLKEKTKEFSSLDSIKKVKNHAEVSFLITALLTLFVPLQYDYG